MNLLDYKEKHRFSYENLSKHFDIERLVLYRICTQPSYCPKLNIAYKISRLSNGEIAIEDLLVGDC